MACTTGFWKCALGVLGGSSDIDSTLPDGWHSAKDPKSGRQYYWSPKVNKGRAQWQWPNLRDMPDVACPKAVELSGTRTNDVACSENSLVAVGAGDSVNVRRRLAPVPVAQNVATALAAPVSIGNGVSRYLPASINGARILFADDEGCFRVDLSDVTNDPSVSVGFRRSMDFMDRDQEFLYAVNGERFEGAMRGDWLETSLSNLHKKWEDKVDQQHDISPVVTPRRVLASRGRSPGSALREPGSPRRASKLRFAVARSARELDKNHVDMNLTLLPGRLLGLKGFYDETGALQVKDVSQGLVKEWNKANPHHAVGSGDIVIAANDHILCSGEDPMGFVKNCSLCLRVQRIIRPDVEKIQYDEPDWEVDTIQTCFDVLAGQQLGLCLFFDKEGRFLVRRINDGPIKELNKAKPINEKVCVGDAIMAVNGKNIFPNDDAAMRNRKGAQMWLRLRKNKTL